MKKRIINLCLVLFAVLIFSGCEKKLQNNEDTIIKDTQNSITKDQQKEQKSERQKELEEFNDSGRAKAIEEESDLWQVYEDEDAGFMLKYPFDVELSGEKAEVGQGEGAYQLTIESLLVRGLEGTMGFNEETAVKNIKSLENGEYGEEVDWPIKNSKKVRKIGIVNAQEFMALSRFEICNVTFERKLYFIKNGYQVVLTLKTPSEGIIEAMPDYFDKNIENCGDLSIWNFDKQEEFYSVLENGRGAVVAQEWYDKFEEIVATIGFLEDSVESEEMSQTNLEKIQGKWLSVDDEKSEIEFKQQKQIQFYDKKKVSEDDFALFDDEMSDVASDDGKILIVGDLADDMKYTIIELNDKNLVLNYLARGNELRYVRE